VNDRETWEFYRHMPVFLAGGRKLGYVIEVGHAVDFIHVQQGRILVRDWYVPSSAIAQVGPRGVVLTARREDLVANRWHIPPTEFLMCQGATPGYEYTSPVDLPGYGGTGAEALSQES
jgi:hypothetical protein